MLRIIRHGNVEYLIDDEYSIIASEKVVSKWDATPFQEFFDTVEDWEDAPYLMEGFEWLQSINEVILAVKIHDVLSNNRRFFADEITLQYASSVVENKESITELLTNF